MQIYGITGMPLSGKTLAAEILEDQGYSVIDMGDIVRIERDKREIGVEKTNEFVNEMREEHGQDAIAKLTQPYLEELTEEENKIVITGMRSLEEKQYFEAENDEIETIAIWASEEIRKQRKRERQREEDIKGQKFHQRDLREIENGVGRLMALSDYLIKNNFEEKQKLEQKIRKEILTNEV